MATEDATAGQGNRYAATVSDNWPHLLPVPHRLGRKAFRCSSSTEWPAQHAQGRHRHVVVVSGTKDAARSAADLEAAACLEEPVGFDELVEAVRQNC